MEQLPLEDYQHLVESLVKHLYQYFPTKGNFVQVVVHTPPDACSNLKVSFQSKTLYILKVHTCRVLFIAKLEKVMEGFSEKSQKTVHNNVKN